MAKSMSCTPMGWGPIFSGFDRAVSKVINRFEAYLRWRGVVPLLIILFWACAVLPNLTVRSFIWEEGTNAEIARDVLAHGHFIEPFVYGIRWHEKPSLLPWLIAGVAALTGRVDEWSVRLPGMISVLLTALLVQRTTRRYATLHASLFSALSFLFCPLLLQKLTHAEPDTVITLLSFAALLVWWNGMAAARISILRWIGCGCLLAILSMAKGPQPTGFFALGVAAYLIIERRWRDVPGWFLCMTLPLAATIAWGAAVYQPGDEATWLAYARLSSQPLHGYIARNIYITVVMIIEMLPATMLLPFVPWPWRRNRPASSVPSIIAPLSLYSGVCTAALVLWPGFSSRYAMPIAPSLAVLAGIGWDTLKKSKYSIFQRVAGSLLCLFITYQFVLVTVIMPMFSDRFGSTRNDASAIEQAIRTAPAPIFCFYRDNQLFYLRVPFRCLNLFAGAPSLAESASLTPPAWLIIPHSLVSEFAQLRPDLNVTVAVETTDLTATRVDKK